MIDRLNMVVYYSIEHGCLLLDKYCTAKRIHVKHFRVLRLLGGAVTSPSICILAVRSFTDWPKFHCLVTTLLNYLRFQISKVYSLEIIHLIRSGWSECFYFEILTTISSIPWHIFVKIRKILKYGMNPLLKRSMLWYLTMNSHTVSLSIPRTNKIENAPDSRVRARVLMSAPPSS